MSVTRYHAELTKVDKDKNEFIIYPKTTISDVYTDSTSGVHITGKLSYYAECSTAWDTKQKKVTIPGFVLDDGVQVSVKFTAENSVFLSTTTTWGLQINNGTVYSIEMSNNGDTNPVNLISSGDTITFVFSKSKNKFIRKYAKSSLPVSMNDDKYTSRVYLAGVNNINYLTPGTYTTTDAIVTRSTVYVEGDTFHATKFEGDGSKLTNISAANLKTGTISGNLLPDIAGLVASSYGPPAEKTLSHDGDFVVPCFDVDKKGRIVSIKNQTLKLPNDNNDKVKVTTTTAVKNFRLVLIDPNNVDGDASMLNAGKYLYYDPGNKKLYVENDIHVTGEVRATYLRLYKSDGTVAATLTGTTYTGQAATVASITEHISSSVESSSKAYPASSGIELYNTVEGMKTSKQDTITGAATTITSSNLTANHVVVSDANGKIATSSITTTQLNYLSGVTSNVQTQLSNITNAVNAIGTIYSNSKFHGAVAADEEIYDDKNTITVPAGSYVIRVAAHGIWKSTKITLRLGYSTNNMSSYSFPKTAYLPDSGENLDHNVSQIWFMQVTSPATFFPAWVTNASTSYTESNKNAVTLAIEAIKIR